MAFAAVAASAATSLTTACSLDWSVRAEPTDAAPAAEVGVDAPVGTDAADAESAATDAPLGDGADCTKPAADVVVAKARARDCTLGQVGQCTTTVADECGCPVIVKTAGSAESMKYATAVAALVACNGGAPPASCPAACTALTPPASWGCLQPTTIPHCTPPNTP